jgi:hypothetical protein
MLTAPAGSVVEVNVGVDPGRLNVAVTLCA